jgi:hypothetical protein
MKFTMHRSPARAAFRTAAAVTVVAASATLMAGPTTAAPANPKVNVAPGLEIDVVQKINGDRVAASDACTLGVVAVTPDGKKVGVIAGHCGKTGEMVAARAIGVQNALVEVGRVQKSSEPTEVTRNGLPDLADASQPDWAVLSFLDGVPVSNTGPGVAPTAVGRARVGDPVCSVGRTSGRQCGKVIDVVGNRIQTTVSRRPGDSGSSLIRTTDGAALGIASLGQVKPVDGVDESTFWDLGFIFSQAGGLRLAT